MENLTEKEKEKVLKIREELGKILPDKSFRMILYGSKARGDHAPTSDIDLAFIINCFSAALKKQILDLVVQIECKEFVSTISALILSSERFDRLKCRERRIALEIEKEGIQI